MTLLNSEKIESLDLLSKHPLTYNSPIVEEIIKANKPSLVIFDPYQAYLSHRVDMNKANDVEIALAPIKLLAKKYDCHILILSHNTKAQTGLKYKFMGTVGFIGQARSGFSIVRDPEKVEEQENIIIQTKSNNKLGKSIRYRIESVPGREDYATVKWIGLEDYTERDYIRADASAIQTKINQSVILSDDDPTVAMILNIVKENSDTKEIRIGNYNFAECYSITTGKPLKSRVATEIGRVRTYLEESHGIIVEPCDSRTLMSFKLNGKTIDPYTSQSRCVRIRQSVLYSPGQQTEMTETE